MKRRASVLVCLALVFMIARPREALAQTTYHLHGEASSTPNLFQLRTTGPDMASLALQTGDLNGISPGEQVIAEFDTQAGDPGVVAGIPAGAVVTFQLWMLKTADAGTLSPEAKVFLNNANGTPLCVTSDSSSITTTLTLYSISCNLTQDVTLTAPDRFYVWVGVNITDSPTTTLMAELDIEGTLNGNYDSKVAMPAWVPPPTITSIVPSSAGTYQNVIINGTNFESRPQQQYFRGVVGKTMWFGGRASSKRRGSRRSCPVIEVTT